MANSSRHLPNMRIGDDYVLRLTYPFGTDITGFKFYLTLKASFDDADAALQTSWVAGENTIDEPLIGICFLSVPAIITASIKRGSYFYDLQVITTSGAIETIAPPMDDYKHKIIAVPSVTLATS